MKDKSTSPSSKEKAKTRWFDCTTGMRSPKSPLSMKTSRISSSSCKPRRGRSPTTTSSRSPNILTSPPSSSYYRRCKPIKSYAVFANLSMS